MEMRTQSAKVFIGNIQSNIIFWGNMYIPLKIILEDNMSTITIRKIGITKLDTDAVVNAANTGLREGGGVCGYIFHDAGSDEMTIACNKIGYCAEGSAVITPGFKLPAKYVIHAVGPRWYDGNHNEPKLLYSAYKQSLILAKQNNLHSIGFPLISAGIFGYPVDKAWRKAIQACNDFLDANQDYDINIVFAVLDDTILNIGKSVLNDIVPVFRVAVKIDWNTSDMPESNASFILDRDISKSQMDNLRRGNIPEEMEDKWFWYMEDNRLFAHRSWTGFCIYIIDFSLDGHHKVIVNRDPEQYGCTDIEEDRIKLGKLLDWWTQDNYDHYNEWLSETVDSLKKAGKIKDKLKVSGRVVDAVFFHLPEEPDGYLSNWYASEFILDGIKFTSSEQYIMYQKCMLFGDTKSAQEVLDTDDTALQQKIGRNAKGYVHGVWEGKRQLIAIKGLIAKFTQNSELKQKLLDTGDAWLVECAGSDKIWACGVRLTDDDRFDAEKWSGQNILGFALMEVRAMLKSQ